MTVCELILTYRLRAEVFVSVELVGVRRTLQFEDCICSWTVPYFEPGVTGASGLTDGRLRAMRDGEVALVSIGAVQVGVSVDAPPNANRADLITLVDDARPIADRLVARMIALLGSRGGQFSLGLVEQDHDEVGFPILVNASGQQTEVEHPRQNRPYAMRDRRSISTDQWNSFLDNIENGNDAYDIFRLLADAYFLCHRSSSAELRHAALLGSIACEVAGPVLIRQLCSPAQLPIIDVLLSRRPHVVLLFNDIPFAIKGRRLHDERAETSARLEKLQAYRNKVAHEGALPPAVVAEDIRTCIDAAMQAIEWLGSI